MTAINAGVSAYSSTQSLRYLKLRGQALQPDLILFYHEYNDYLPTIIRDTDANEAGIIWTDKELLDSRFMRVNRFLMEKSSLYRYLALSYSRRKFKKVAAREIPNPLSRIGMPSEYGRWPLVLRDHNGVAITTVDQMNLTSRVTEKERRENLAELWKICSTNRIGLVLIHPTYVFTEKHACLLTEFAARNNAPLFETFSTLRPDNAPRNALYVDTMASLPTRARVAGRATLPLHPGTGARTAR